jgi:hypothetical protein
MILSYHDFLSYEVKTSLAAPVEDSSFLLDLSTKLMYNGGIILHVSCPKLSNGFPLNYFFGVYKKVFPGKCNFDSYDVNKPEIQLHRFSQNLILYEIKHAEISHFFSSVTRCTLCCGLTMKRNRR